jgi:hypothetical protein
MGDSREVQISRVPTPLRRVAEQRGWGPEKVARQTVAAVIDYYTGNPRQTLQLMEQDGWERDLLPSEADIRALASTRDWQLALEKRGEEISVGMHNGVAKVREVKAYLTQIMRSETASERDKLQAAKLLGQTYSLFTERKQVDLSGELSLQALLDEADQIDAKEE